MTAGGLEVGDDVRFRAQRILAMEFVDLYLPYQSEISEPNPVIQSSEPSACS